MSEKAAKDNVPAKDLLREAAEGQERLLVLLLEMTAIQKRAVEIAELIRLASVPPS
jgi:hypothetical protein